MYQCKNTNKPDFYYLYRISCWPRRRKRTKNTVLSASGQSVFRFLKSPLARVVESHVSCRDGRFCVTEKKISCQSLGPATPPPPIGCKSTRGTHGWKGVKGSGECRVVFRSSIQFIDGLTALLGPCYAGARCRAKKINWGYRSEKKGEWTERKGEGKARFAI